MIKDIEGSKFVDEVLDLLNWRECNDVTPLKTNWLDMESEIKAVYRNRATSKSLVKHTDEYYLIAISQIIGWHTGRGNPIEL